MPHLHISVRLHDTVVEDRLCEVDGLCWLGDAPSPLVAFPGGSLWVEPCGDHLLVRGQPLRLRERLVLHYGSVEVTLECTEAIRLDRDWTWAPDPALLAATAALVLAGAFVDLWSMGQAPPQTLAAQAEKAAAHVRVTEVGYEQPVADTGVPERSWTPSVTFTPSKDGTAVDLEPSPE